MVLPVGAAHMEIMTKHPKPVPPVDPETVENWENEGGAPAAGDRTTARKRRLTSPRTVDSQRSV